MDEIRQNVGSRNSDGNVVDVNWNDDKANVNWYNPDNADDNLRFREKFQKKRTPFNCWRGFQIVVDFWKLQDFSNMPANCLHLLIFFVNLFQI